MERNRKEMEKIQTDIEKKVERQTKTWREKREIGRKTFREMERKTVKDIQRNGEKDRQRH